MSKLRKQSIVSSIVIYIGFFVGFINTYLFAREGKFTEAQYGLTGIFIAIAMMMMAVAQMGTPAYIYKFYPYYKDNIEPRKNDMLSWALLASTIGFGLVVVLGIILKSLVVKKYGTNSPELITYYNWIFPLGFGLTIFSVLEAYAWQLKKSVLTNFLKETMWRLFTTLLIVLFFAGIIGSFDLFIKLFAFTYPGIAIILIIHLLYTKQLHFNFSLSRVTKKFSTKILTLCAYVYTGSVVYTLSFIFDSLIIASKLENAMMMVGIYTLAQNFAALIQAPQRAIISAAVSHLSQAWKDKNMVLIQKIYQRSSINQLIFAIGLFLLIALNFSDAVYTFKLKETFLQGFTVFLLLGATRIVDMGTGVNSQIIGTSIHWRFELVSGVVLLLLMLPLNYLLTSEYGIVGPAIANLISISIYNIIRIYFLWKKYKLFPFTIQSLYTILLAGASFVICFYIFKNMSGLIGMTLRSLSFILIYFGGTYFMNLSPDVKPVLETIKKRLKM
jgi:O-antigen/teichoic acid export membrane protein